MSDLKPWPELSWEVGRQRLEWLTERIDYLAKRARAFELALEEASEAGEAALSQLADELSEWEQVAANVYMYAGLGAALQISSEDVPSHAEELEKVWRELIGLREKLLNRLGPSAARVLEREEAARIDAAQIRDRVGEIPEIVAEVNPLTGERTLMPTLSQPKGKPVGAEEIRMRQAAEQKPLPEKATLEALLAHAPSDWVAAIFDTLGLELPPDAAAPRAARREMVAAHMSKRENLEALGLGLPDEAQSLLRELIAGGGALRYADVIEKHGLDEADGFFWTERPPSGPLAWLRRLGFAFVGQRLGAPYVVLPSDTLPTLRKVLEG